MLLKEYADAMDYKYPGSNCLNYDAEDWDRLDTICREIGASRPKVLTLLVRRYLEAQKQEKGQQPADGEQHAV
jgi:hypothetical protein